jgi:tRNA G46 methylase TrmB
VAEVLLPGGLLRIKTDHEGYASVVADVLGGEARFEPVSVDRAFEGVPATHFEIKYTRDERAVARLAFRRV